MKTDPPYRFAAFAPPIVRRCDGSVARPVFSAPIDPVYEDRELFADFLTTYYTDHEPESSFVLEVDGELTVISSVRAGRC